MKDDKLNQKTCLFYIHSENNRYNDKAITFITQTAVGNNKPGFELLQSA